MILFDKTMASFPKRLEVMSTASPSTPHPAEEPLASRPSQAETAEDTHLPETPDEEELLTALRLEARYQDAAVWVLIASFAGLAMSSSYGGVAPWLGGLLGGVAALIIGAVLISRMEPLHGA
jgi:hypothetical protein